MDALEAYTPPDPERFNITVRAMVGPVEGEGEESFDINVCTSKWLEEQLENEPFVLGMHRLFVKAYDPPEIRKIMTRIIERFSGSAWNEVAEKISRLAHWEFEGYKQAN